MKLPRKRKEIELIFEEQQTLRKRREELNEGVSEHVRRRNMPRREKGNT